jgi:hypothetical protein
LAGIWADAGTILCWAVGVGVGVGVGFCEPVRLYFIWLNAIEATDNDATVKIMSRVIIRRLDLGLICKWRGY